MSAVGREISLETDEKFMLSQVKSEKMSVTVEA